MPRGHHPRVRHISNGHQPGNLVGPGVQQAVNVGHLADAPTYSQRDEYLSRYPPHHLNHGITSAGTGGDIEERDLVGFLLIVALCYLYRVPGITNLDKAHTFDDPPAIDVQTGDDALGQAHCSARAGWPASGKLLPLAEVQRTLIDCPAGYHRLHT